MTVARDIEGDQVGSEAGPGRGGINSGIGIRSGIGAHRAAAVLTATAGALLVWIVAHPLAGVELTVGAGPSARTIGPGGVVLVSVLAGLAAVGLGALLVRVTARARGVWHIVAVATLVLSLAGPLGAATLGAGAALAAMHLVVGCTLIVGVGRTVSPRRLAQ